MFNINTRTLGLVLTRRNKGKGKEGEALLYRISEVDLDGRKRSYDGGKLKNLLSLKTEHIFGGKLWLMRNEKRRGMLTEKDGRSERRFTGRIDFRAKSLRSLGRKRGAGQITVEKNRLAQGFKHGVMETVLVRWGGIGPVHVEKVRRPFQRKRGEDGPGEEGKRVTRKDRKKRRTTYTQRSTDDSWRMEGGTFPKKRRGKHDAE